MSNDEFLGHASRTLNNMLLTTPPQHTPERAAHVEAERTQARVRARAAVAAFADARPEAALDLLTGLHQDLGMDGVSHALHVLCSVPANITGLHFTPRAEVAIDFPFEPEGNDEDVAAAFAVAKSIAADLLAGTWTNNGVRVSTALSQLHQRNIVMVLVVVTRYVAVVIEAASEENSRIWEAHDQVSAAASTGFGPLS